MGELRAQIQTVKRDADTRVEESEGKLRELQEQYDKLDRIAKTILADKWKIVSEKIKALCWEKGEQISEAKSQSEEQKERHKTQIQEQEKQHKVLALEEKKKQEIQYEVLVPEKEKVEAQLR